MKALTLLSSPILPQHILDKSKNIPDGRAKVDHVAILINMISSEAKKLKSEELQIASKRKQLELLIEAAESELKLEMSDEGICELQGEMIKYSLSNSPPKLIISDTTLIPKEYLRETVTIEIRKDAIKDQLKLGDIIPGAHLETGLTLKLIANKE